MLKLILCELQKYKRIRTVYFLTLFAVLFPCFLVFTTRNRVSKTADIPALYEYYDYLFSNNLAYSFMLFLPCLVGCMGAVIFFAERDNDTFKNLRVIPITMRQLIFTKLVSLYVWVILYSVLTTTAVTLLCALINHEMIYDFIFKILVSILTGFMMASFSLPAVVAVIYFNQNYMVSLLISFSYSILQWLLLILFAQHKTLVEFLPLINGLFWGSLILEYRKNILFHTPLSTVLFSDHLRVVILLFLSVGLSIFLILRFYKKSSR